ncbi:hypothetical protein AB0J77_14730 [Micromonospora tulbaghiae]|uniref:hypothetical protein n=1 Tax=Micromonospora tulbaghiae TaxID=479978 RepID=UPI00341C5EB3
MDADTPPRRPLPTSRTGTRTWCHRRRAAGPARRSFRRRRSTRTPRNLRRCCGESRGGDRVARVVKVDLLLEAARYLKGARDAARATDQLSDSVDDAGKAGERASDATEKLGEDLSGLAADARRLDKDIEGTTRGIRELARQIAATSDEAERAQLVEKLDLERVKQRKQVDLRKLIDFNDNEGVEQGIRYGARFAEGLASGLARAGGPISSALSSVFGGLPPQAQAAIGAGVVAAVASVGPLVGGALGGAIVGAAGAGGVVGGIAVAARHPAVKAAATEVGSVFASTMERAGVSFVPVTLTALGQVRAGIGDMEDDLERAFSASARFVEPLTDDFLAGGERAVEGFANAIELAGPAVDALGEIGRRAGDLVADTFEDLADHATEGAHALMALWTVFEYGIRTLVFTVEGLTAAYGWMEKFSAAARGDVAELARLVAEQEAAKGSSSGLSDDLQELVASFGDTGDAASVAAFEVETFDEMLRRLVDQSLNAEQANLRLEEAIDGAAEAAKDSARKGIDPNTEAGRKNRQALLGVAEAAWASHDAILENTGSQEMASAATERGRAAFLRSAAAMGVSKKEAVELANKLFGIPKKVETKADFQADNKGVSDWKRTLSGIPRNIFTSARLRAIVDVDVRREQATEATGRRWGGITEHAQWGVLREAHIASPQGPARYAYAEPATGGEAFVPRLGDPRRSLDILDRAASWYGATVQRGQTAAPRYVSAGGGATVINNSVMVNVAVPATANKAEVGREIAGALDDWAHKNGVVWRQRKGAA